MPSARRGKPARPSRPVLDAAGLSLPTTPEAGSPPKGTRGSWGSPLRPNRQRGTPQWGTTVQAPTRRWGSCTACVGLRKTGRLDPFPGQRGTATTGHPTPTRTAAEDAAGGMVPKPPGTLPSRSLGGPSWKARSQTNGLPRKERETGGPLPPFTPTSHGGIRGDHEGPKGRVDGDHKMAGEHGKKFCPCSSAASGQRGWIRRAKKDLHLKAGKRKRSPRTQGSHYFSNTWTWVFIDAGFQILGYAYINTYAYLIFVSQVFSLPCFLVQWGLGVCRGFVPGAPVDTKNLWMLKSY